MRRRSRRKTQRTEEEKAKERREIQRLRLAGTISPMKAAEKAKSAIFPMWEMEKEDATVVAASPTMRTIALGSQRTMVGSL